MSSERSLSPADATSTAPRLPDLALAALVVAVQLGLARASATWHAGAPAPGGWDYLLLAAGGAALAFRRRFPVAVLAAALATTFWVTKNSTAQAVWLTLIVAFGNVVLARRRAAAVASLAAGYVLALWPPWRIGQPGGPKPVLALWLAGWLLVLLSAAELIRLRNQRAQALARSQQEEMRRQASEERLRMAREIHDVVAHSISVINVQASTALHLKDRQPGRAWEALATINETAKQALVELRSVLGVLRQAGEGEPRAPTPGLDRLDELIERARAAGLTVRLERSGGTARLPANVELAAYRIVQEALTNSAKHAVGSTVRVRLGCDNNDLVIRVDDDGRARDGQPGQPRPAPLAGGNGLAGMRERAHALHGTLTAAARPGGGFTVHARLPLAEAAGDLP